MARGDRVIQYGFQKGSQAAKIHEKIGKQAKSFEEIAGVTGLPEPRVRSHAHYWITYDLFYEMTGGGVRRRSYGDQPGQG